MPEGSTEVPQTRDGSPVGPVVVVLALVNERMVWIDCEMTGLDLVNDALIEVAALVTDFDLNVSATASTSSSSPRPRRWTR